MSPRCPPLPADDGGGAPARRRGRPLDPALDSAICRAVLRVLDEVGYRGLTMDAVAAAAAVSKATIYRRWTSKVQLLVSALDAGSGPAADVDSGSLREDLIGCLST